MRRSRLLSLAAAVLLLAAGGAGAAYLGGTIDTDEAARPAQQPQAPAMIETSFDPAVDRVMLLPTQRANPPGHDVRHQVIRESVRQMICDLHLPPQARACPSPN